MKNDVHVKNGIVIPEQELEITTSRSGGAGGQHVNKTSTRISVRWNVKSTSALNDQQKARVLEKLQTQLTTESDLIVHNSSTRSQQQNKQLALQQLGYLVRKALHVAKKRIATKIPRAVKEAQLQEKKRRSSLKKMRKIIYDE